MRANAPTTRNQRNMVDAITPNTKLADVRKEHDAFDDGMTPPGFYDTHYVARPITMPESGDDAPLLVDGGSTFEDACVVAMDRARSTPSGDAPRPSYVAQGILQAADGAYRVTALSGDTGAGGFTMIDGWGDRYASGTEITAAHDAIQAVVGGEKWVDLRAERSGRPQDIVQFSQ